METLIPDHKTETFMREFRSGTSVTALQKKYKLKYPHLVYKAAKACSTKHRTQEHMRLSIHSQEQKAFREKNQKKATKLYQDKVPLRQISLQTGLTSSQICNNLPEGTRKRKKTYKHNPQVIELRKQGHTYLKIAEITGLPLKVVYGYFPQGTRDDLKERNQKIYQDHHNGKFKSHGALGMKYNLSANEIRKILRKMGVKPQHNTKSKAYEALSKKLIQAYQRGEKTSDICRKHKITYARIYRALETAGIPRRQNRITTTYTQQTRKAALKDYQEGKITIGEILAKHNVPQWLLNNWRIAAGIPIRSR